MAFLTRWDEDQSQATVKAALRDLAVRAILPATVLLGVIIGSATSSTLFELSEDENQIDRDLQDARDALRNSITHLMSSIGNTEYVIGVCLIVVGLVWWRTKQWWYAVVPASRSASRPPCSSSPPTSSAAPGRRWNGWFPDAPDIELPERARRARPLALYLAFGLMATRIDNTVVRRLAITWCVLAPAFVAYARLYRGAHHVTDIVVAILNGVVCAVLATALPASEVRGH